MSVTIYTTGPACYKCNLTKDRFRKAGIAFEEILLADDPEAHARFKDEGRLVAPIVVTDTDTWNDFRIDKIRETIREAPVAA